MGCANSSCYAADVPVESSGSPSTAAPGPVTSAACQSARSRTGRNLPRFVFDTPSATWHGRRRIPKTCREDESWLSLSSEPSAPVPAVGRGSTISIKSRRSAPNAKATFIPENLLPSKEIQPKDVKPAAPAAEPASEPASKEEAAGVEIVSLEDVEEATKRMRTMRSRRSKMSIWVMTRSKTTMPKRTTRSWRATRKTIPMCPA